MTIEIQRSELSRLSAAIESVPTGLIVADASGRIVMVNHEIERLFGYPRAELLTMSVERLAPERLREALREFRHHFVNEPQPLPMGAGQGLGLAGLTKGGSEVPLEIGITPIMTGDGLFVVSSVVDISARAQADAQFRAAVESLPSGMVMVDVAGRIVLVNREVERMFGYERDALLGESVETLIPARFRSGHAASWAEFHKGPRARPMGAGREVYGLRRDRSEFPLEVGINPIEIGDARYVLGSIVDISARVKEESVRAELELQLRRAQHLESLGRLAGGIAHDFNNILAIILSLAELASHPVEGRPAPELGEIIHATSRGRDLVQRILLFSSSGRGVSSAPVDLALVVPQGVLALRAALPPDVDVQVHLGSPAPVVRSDTTAISQILSNLITNAGHAMAGGGRIDVRVDHFAADAELVRMHAGLSEGTYARIEVADSGAGMDAATRERAFEPFFTTRGPHAGTGLGLAIVRALTHDEGGAVWLESDVGRGTTVTCLLPIAQEAARSRDDGGQSSLTPVVHEKRVLYVEDEPALAAATGHLLRRAGYDVVVHTDALAALAAFTASPGEWDLMVTDHAMPQLSGLDLAAQVHGSRPDLPIVLVTGRTDTFTAADLEASGVVSVLTKPAAVSTLVAAMEEARKPLS